MKTALSIPDFAIGWFFRFCFRLGQPSFHWIISDVVVNGIGRNGNVPSSYDSAYDSDFRFSLGHKLSYDSDYDSVSDFVASENQPQLKLEHAYKNQENEKKGVKNA